MVSTLLELEKDQWQSRWDGFSSFWLCSDCRLIPLFSSPLVKILQVWISFPFPQSNFMCNTTMEYLNWDVCLGSGPAYLTIAMAAISFYFCFCPPHNPHNAPYNSSSTVIFTNKLNTMHQMVVLLHHFKSYCPLNVQNSLQKRIDKNMINAHLNNISLSII